MRQALPALAAMLLLNLAAYRMQLLPFPDPSGMRISRADAAQSAALLSLGMRRLAADISFIQLLMYYGSAEEELAHPGAPRDPWEPPEHHHDAKEENGGGDYPEIEPRALRILDLDPFFTYAALYSAGVLAFNLDRPGPSLEVLRRAARLNPKEWKYRAYIGAVGFHKKGDPESVLAELSPVVIEPDCPVMIKNIAAFLSKRAGHRELAVRLYGEILFSKDQSYRVGALKALKELGAR